MADYDLVIEESGAPALVLAGASIIDPDTRSGNPAHEIASGRFGFGRRRKAPVAGPSKQRQPVADDASEVRRRDAVVDAARTLTDLSPDGVRALVRQRWRGTRALTEQDVTEFAADARKQRIDDIVDSLDNRIRQGVLKRNKNVHVSFPRGLIRSSMRGLDDNEVNDVLQRLRFRGWSETDVVKHVVRPFVLKDKGNP